MHRTHFHHALAQLVGGSRESLAAIAIQLSGGQEAGSWLGLSDREAAYLLDPLRTLAELQAFFDHGYHLPGTSYNLLLYRSTRR